ncbi:MAG: branched-chain amino acid ABC transporter permease [Pseudomonadota bacterium]
MDIVLLNFLNGASYGMVLFLIAAGLSLVLGVMGIVNLAHGAIFVAGGFIGLTVAHGTGSFLLGILSGAVGSGLIGLVIERGILRLLYKRDLQQVLVTFGFVYIINNLILWIWGPSPRAAFVPSYFSGAIPIANLSIPVHRFAIIGAGAVICIILWWIQDKTRIGAIIRAGMDNAEIVSGLGINLTPINAFCFLLGSFVAGAGAVIGVQLFGSFTFNDGLYMLLYAIAVVVVGGVGNVQGALAGAMLIGIVDTYGRVYFPQIAEYTMYILLILILMVRPSGILGRKV